MQISFIPVIFSITTPILCFLILWQGFKLDMQIFYTKTHLNVIKISVSLFRSREATLNQHFKTSAMLLGSDVLHNWVQFVGSWKSTEPELRNTCSDDIVVWAWSMGSGWMLQNYTSTNGQLRISMQIHMETRQWKWLCSVC